MKIDKNLKAYLKNSIMPKYENEHSGHGTSHITEVAKRSIKLAKKIDDINFNMVLTIAVFHDLACLVSRENHEIESAKLCVNDNFIKNFFNEEQLTIIKEAIEDHRASLKTEPRTIYGKIVSTADRNCSVNTTLLRSYKFAYVHNKNFSKAQIFEVCYNHINDKFGVNGYAHIYIENKEWIKYKKRIIKLLSNKTKFYKKMEKLTKKI